jgi:hypothetical protein
MRSRCKRREPPQAECSGQRTEGAAPSVRACNLANVAGWQGEADVDDLAAYTALATDRLWCGYAIADLEAPFRAYTRVAVAHRAGAVAACVVLRHPDFCAVVPHGPPAGLEAILERIDLPRQTHLFALEQHLPTVRQWFAYDHPVPMLRMAVTAASFVNSAVEAAVDRLGPADVAALTELYAAYADNAFHPDQLASGVFYGIRDRGRLLAAAGTHVVSARYGIAAIGNIVTRPAARGRGLATAAVKPKIDTMNNQLDEPKPAAACSGVAMPNSSQATSRLKPTADEASTSDAHNPAAAPNSNRNSQTWATPSSAATSAPNAKAALSTRQPMTHTRERATSGPPRAGRRSSMSADDR